jgi:hypothetical protein
MKMIDEKFADMSGREFRLYTVRSMGRGQGFGVLNRYRNIYIRAPFSTREECWAYLRETDA